MVHRLCEEDPAPGCRDGSACSYEFSRSDHDDAAGCGSPSEGDQPSRKQRDSDTLSRSSKCHHAESEEHCSGCCRIVDHRLAEGCQTVHNRYTDVVPGPPCGFLGGAENPVQRVELVERALEAASSLEADGVCVAVLHSPTLKPFDEEALLAQLGKGRLVLTAENHSVVGGLFDIVARTVAAHGLGERIHPIALPDEFLDAGALPTLADRYGVSTGAIVDKVRGLL